MMRFGEPYEIVLIDAVSGERIPHTATCKRAEWHGYHTDREGNGLWAGDRQIAGTCDFSVSGCMLEKSAKDKIRRFVKNY